MARIKGNLTHQLLGEFEFLVVKANKETPGKNGMLEDPPKLYLVWIDLEYLEPRMERISFDAAAILAPDKFERAMKMLAEARERDRPMTAQEKLELECLVALEKDYAVAKNKVRDTRDKT